MGEVDIEPMYSTGKVAELLEVSPYTVREWIRHKKLHAVKWGGEAGYWRVPKSALHEFLNKRHGPDDEGVEDAGMG